MQAVYSILYLFVIERLMGIALQDIGDIITCLRGYLISKCFGIECHAVSSWHRYKNGFLMFRNGSYQSCHDGCCLVNTFLVTILDTVCQGTNWQVVGR